MVNDLFFFWEPKMINIKKLNKNSVCQSISIVIDNINIQIFLNLINIAFIIIQWHLKLQRTQIFHCKKNVLFNKNTSIQSFNSLEVLPKNPPKPINFHKISNFFHSLKEYTKPSKKQWVWRVFYEEVWLITSYEYHSRKHLEFFVKTL